MINTTEEIIQWMIKNNIIKNSDLKNKIDLLLK